MARSAHEDTFPAASLAVARISSVSLETWELMSYVVTVIGLPLAICVFLFEQRKERENEEEEVYQLLSDNYQDFLKVALTNPDLRLFSDEATPSLSDEQEERQLIIFTMLMSLFGRVYLLLYEDAMSPKQARRWNSWEDYIMVSQARFSLLSPQATSRRGSQLCALCRATGCVQT